MRTLKRPRDIAERAAQIGQESTAEPAQSADELAQAFWEETGIVAPMVEIQPPLTDRWGEAERWAQWRAWLVRRKMGGKPHDQKAASRKGGLRGGKARAAALSPERRSEIAKRAAEARWKK